MPVQRIEAGEIGLDNIGSLDMLSGWSDASGCHQVNHQVPTGTLYVDPGRVLFWDSEPSKLNSLKRFNHMLQLRGVAILEDPESYGESLSLAIVDQGLAAPSSKRLRTLSNLANRYYTDSADGQRITRLATSTARILFHYEPPQGVGLEELQRYALKRFNS